MTIAASFSRRMRVEAGAQNGQVFGIAGLVRGLMRDNIPPQM